MEIKTVKISELKPHPNNPRVHPDSAIDKLVKSIKEFGWTNPVLASEEGIVLAGHARVKAAEQAGIEEVPVIFLPLKGTKADAYLVADNRLQQETDWDMPKLRDLLEELDTGEIDMGLTGFDTNELEELFNIGNIEVGESNYSTNIEAPQYQITGEKPDIKELCDDQKYKELIKGIEVSNLDKDEKEFLKKAATRHNVFTYSKIAEYYAHADKEMQELMERSALVIIDYDDAMRDGYIQIKSFVDEIISEDSELEE